MEDGGGQKYYLIHILNQLHDTKITHVEKRI